VVHAADRFRGALARAAVARDRPCDRNPSADALPVSGHLVGAIIHTGGLGIAQTFDWIVSAIIVDDGFHVQILLFTLLLGSGVALIWRLGGAIAVRRWATERLESQRAVGLTTWGLGLAMFFDDYANTAIIGSTMREISDELRVSREKLAYIVDSTAAPVATLGISSWVAFQLSLISSAYEDMGVASEAPTAFATFVGSIPYNTYALLAIVMVGIVVYTGRDYGEMLDAEHRSRTTGRSTARAHSRSRRSRKIWVYRLATVRCFEPFRARRRPDRGDARKGVLDRVPVVAFEPGRGGSADGVRCRRE